MSLRLILLGAPGAGKGTQAKRVADAHGLPHISTGDIFRKHLKEGTELGRQVQQYLEGGRLVPDELTCAIVADRLNEPDCAKGYILDGFPRSVGQAEALSALLAKKGQEIDAAVDIAVPDSEIVDRLSARRSCPVCGNIYNLKYSPPPDGGNACGREGCPGQLVQREDDKEETIRERLRVYHETTEPVIGYYRNQGLLHEIPASGLSPDAVYAKIEDVLATLSGT